MIDLNEKYINYIRKEIRTNLPNCNIYIFGSRAKGTSKKYSDIDIALSDESLNNKILSTIKNNFENSTLPYEVDVIDLNNITEDFYNLIKNDLVEL
ncbi:MAG: nucleotidyltransferase domain-containing protein [Candidatus Gastranaerophilales bacterium]|nr:nucleotidyltransferase domain-containing protein [Candidatus Gastranaerophilales bacterium]